MLTNIGIHNFKCFEALSLPLSPLTLLTGFNAAGKSTALQSILLLSQAIQSGGYTKELPLNGALVHLGTPGEILNSGDGSIAFLIENEFASVEWALQSEDRTKGIAMQITNIITKGSNGVKELNPDKVFELLLPKDIENEIYNLVKQLKDVIFLSATRIGTTDVFPSPEEVFQLNADVGIQGEFAPWWFQQFMDQDIDDARCNISDDAKTLRRQFNAWASNIFPGVQANVQSIDKTNLLRLELRIGDNDWRRPSNIGYGLTYVFPIIVAGLLAKPNQILIIDSPEAHLHPMGQSMMGRFLAQVAAAGVQVIVETHSDHVLNGVRLAVLDKIMTPDNVAIHFFKNSTKENQKEQVISLSVDINGNLNEWPNGFFDQSENDMAKLAGWI